MGERSPSHDIVPSGDNIIEWHSQVHPQPRKYFILGVGEGNCGILSTSIVWGNVRFNTR